jgi:hypothetical protein
LSWKEEIKKFLGKEDTIKVHVETVTPKQKIRPAEYVDGFANIEFEKEEKDKKELVAAR